jgi:hypothetical protein
MKKLSLSLVCLVWAAACTPDIPQTPSPSVITARFDPSAIPPIVPTPNDLATNPATGNLAVPIVGTAADKEFYAFLNTLNGFPASAGAAATFDGELNGSTVGASSVKVYDVTNSLAEVTPSAIVYTSTGDATVPGRIDVAPPTGGWTPGHTYAVAIIGGDKGVKGGNGNPVVASPTFAFLRNEASLITCEDEMAHTGCLAATEIIPSSISDAAKRLADQTAKATQLEGLRLKYKPTIDKVVAGGAARTDVVLAWHFKINTYTQLQFNPAAVPPQVPTPNDLAIDPTTGLVKAPVDPNSSLAQQEFTTDYLNTLNGFPVSAAANAILVGGDLDETTIVNGSVDDDGNPDPASDNVRVVDLVTGEDVPGVVITYSSTTKQLAIAPPNGTWGKGKHLAVVIVGGKNGVFGTNGKPIVGTETWALARSKASLVTCDDLTAADCKPAISAAPLSTAQAIALEGLRREYSPVIDLTGVARIDLALLWVFSTVDQPEATFDPAKSIIPFPNNLLINPTTGKLNLPDPGGTGLAHQLVLGLNTLDGFSTTAMAVSENADGLGALDEDEIDPLSLSDGGTAGFVKLAAGGLQPKVKICLNCNSSTRSDGGTIVLFPDGGALVPAPQQLQWVPQLPLEEKVNYAGFVTTKLKDTQGRNVIAAPAFALLRMKNTLVDANGKSQVSGVSDANAAALEPARLGLKPMFDALDASGLKRTNLALAFSYKTEHTVSDLQSIVAVPGLLPAGTAFPSSVGDISAQAFAAMNAQGIPHSAVGKVFQAQIVLPFLLNGPGGTFNPNPAAIQGLRAPALIATPAAAPTGAGYPVLVFGHGLGRSRTDMFAMVQGATQAGFAVVAIDAIYHGDRSFCTGFAAAQTPPLASDDGACNDPVNQKCDVPTGRCVARTGTGSACTFGVAGDFTCQAAGQGLCLQSNFCEGGDFKRSAAGVPIIAAWNYLNLVNLFATRDNFRYAPLDNAQLLRVIKQGAAGGASLRERLIALDANAQLDVTKFHYVGQSLGGLNGAMTSAVNTDFQRMGLNVPAADQVTLLLQSPTLAPQRAGFLGLLGTLGIIPGSPAFDQFMVLARTIVDPADPLNFIHTGVNASMPPTRKIYIQYIEQDQFVINSTTEELIAAASQGTATPLTTYFQPPAAFPLAKRHGFFLDPTGQIGAGTDNACAAAGAPPLFNGCLTAQAQFKMASFLLGSNTP